jgi:predicted Rossmann fold nucleotide-binding protein DprA/Smf involved in DNA uptake
MVQAQPCQEAVHPDTQAVLLLCGTFAKESVPGMKPLGLREYNAVASWLARQGRRPADLLRTSEEPIPDGEPGLPQRERLQALLGRGVQMATAVERWQRLGLWVISRGEACYPERLRRNLRSAAPALLYGAGDIARLGQGGLAIVGSRDVDEEVLSFTRQVAERCAGVGVQVVSGGARGVDQAAVLAALEAGGGAVAVLADRLDQTATSREAKEWIRRGALTLVTPYEPEGGFTVGKAMGRNKHIYALADYGLVVRFTREQGGTWAGAVEQLGQHKPGSTPTPVFVRTAHNPEDGCRELCRRGALPFPEEAFSRENVVEVLRQAASPQPDLRNTTPPESTAPEGSNGPATAPPDRAVQSEPAAPPVEAAAQAGRGEVTPTPAPEEAPPPAPEADTCYTRCLPLLLQSLREEPGPKQLAEIAKRLETMLPQLKQWLKRAVEEGKVTMKKKGKRSVYVDAAREKESNLFHRGGDAA